MCSYRSRKIGDKLYLVNFKYEPSAAFVTIVFNFNQNVFSTSALLGAGTEKELVLFEAGIIEQLTLDRFKISYTSVYELSEEKLTQIKDAITKYLEPDLMVEFERKTTLERSARGKLKQFRSYL